MTSQATAAPEQSEATEPSKPEEVAPSKQRAWPARLLYGIVIAIGFCGGIGLGLLGQPHIKPGKEPIVEIPHQIIDAPDATALPIIQALIGRAESNIIGDLSVPLSTALIETLSKAAQKPNMLVRISLPLDAARAAQMLESGGVRVKQTSRLAGNWLALDGQILILSTLPLNADSLERYSGRITIIRGSMAETYIARSRR